MPTRANPAPPLRQISNPEEYAEDQATVTALVPFAVAVMIGVAGRMVTVALPLTLPAQPL